MFPSFTITEKKKSISLALLRRLNAVILLQYGTESRECDLNMTAFCLLQNNNTISFEYVLYRL